MPQCRISVLELLDRLEQFHRPQEPCFPVDPYEFLVWWHCGYPASDVTCAKGWERLTAEVGIEPGKLLHAKPAKLIAALKAGGMVPELRAQRLKEIALRVENEFGGDLPAGLRASSGQARKALKKFPGIADPGADRILLFAGIAPIAAVPSNCPQVLIRIVKGQESASYSDNYREAQRLLSELPETLEARSRAYLLLKRHGQEICKRTNPKCEKCPISSKCVYFSAA